MVRNLLNEEYNNELKKENSKIKVKGREINKCNTIIENK
jgi:hypothetical protein